MSAIAWSNYEIGNHRLSCPACGRGERDKTLGITIDTGGNGVAHCFRCGIVETYREGGARVTPPPRKARIRATSALAKHEALSDYGRELWDVCGPLSGVAAEYLKARCCLIPPVDGDLRWHSSLKHPSGYIGPALVALVTNTITGEPMSLHKTWIGADGRKADVDPPRLLLAGHTKQGGVIRLWPNEAVTSGLAVAEGIETALSLAWGYAPVWAVIDAGNLKALPVLPGIETLVIGADNDAAGTAAARACAARWADAGAEVLITRQPENDLNDALMEAA
jgi:putative DNA primase/helicase